ncbi:MAG: hypothetical protein ACXVA9_08920, partial [Bdellovibrionales bacterium]
MLNVSGHSLVEMTIGIAVMGAMIVALASVNDFIGKENNSIRETMAVLQVERDVINAITKRDVTNTKLPFCDMLFTNAGNLVNPASLPFDATLVTPVNPYKFAIKAIPGIGGIADVAAAAGARVNTLSESLFL